MGRRKLDSQKTTEALRIEAVDKAWKNEVELVRCGKGTRQWTKEEQKELLLTGRIAGYYGHHMQSVSVYKDKAGLPDNIQLLTFDEHLNGAHQGSFRDHPTNGYYDHQTGKTREFKDGIIIPVEVLVLDKNAWDTAKEREEAYREGLIRRNELEYEKKLANQKRILRDRPDLSEKEKSERLQLLESKYEKEKEEFRRQTMTDRDNTGIESESVLDIMQKISGECQRKESVTGAKLGDMETSWIYAQRLISEWDQLQGQIALYQQEMITLGNSVRQISNTIDRSRLADDPQAKVALQQLKEDRASFDRVVKAAQDTSIRKDTVKEKLSQSRKTLRDNIGNIEPDYLENKEIRSGIVKYREKVVYTLQKLDEISGHSYGTSFAKAVCVAKSQLNALDNYYERITVLMRRTVELVKESESCINKINGRIGEDEDSQYTIGEKTLHR